MEQIAFGNVGCVPPSSVSYPLHPFALLLPEMREDELGELARSIEVHGQLVPATTWVDTDDIEYLLDGRHRAWACEQLGIPLQTERLAGSEAVARAHVLAANVHRRHLSPSARAVAAASLSTRGPGRSQTGSAAGLTQAEAARSAGVSERLVRAARSFSGDSALVARVLAGNLTVTQAEKEARAASAARLAERRTSSTDEWLTPEWVVSRVATVLGGIGLDPCAEPGRAIPAERHFTIEDDALAAASWASPDGAPTTVFMNPPYLSTWRFVKRLLEEVDAGRVSRALLLIPGRIGSEYVAELARRGPRVELTGRLRFGPGRGATATARGEAPFASMLCGIGISPQEMLDAFGDVGAVMTFWRTPSQD